MDHQSWLLIGASSLRLLLGYRCGREDDPSSGLSYLASLLAEAQSSRVFPAPASWEV